MDASEICVLAERAVREDLQEICVAAISAANERFPTQAAIDVLDLIGLSSLRKITASKKFKQSALGLIVDDLHELPSWNLRAALLQEYIAPNPEILRQRYDSYGRYELPWLYLKYYTRGIIDRVSLK